MYDLSLGITKTYRWKAGYMDQIKLSKGVRVSPIVADETLYILTSDAKVIALR